MMDTTQTSQLGGSGFWLPEQGQDGSCPSLSPSPAVDSWALAPAFYKEV